MTKGTPKVSIGLPVYNGENYLIEALDSLLTQTFEDFELIISDNASTDNTQEICQAYAAKDARIRYYRQDRNMGTAWNYNFVFEKANADYFKWAAHDDLCAPQFLEKCVTVLDQDPSVVLSYPRTDILYPLDESGKYGLIPVEYLQRYTTIPEGDAIRLHYDLQLNVDSPQIHQRFHDLICIPHQCFPVFGVIRSNILRRTQLIGSFSSSDRTLLAELSLYGRFHEVPEYLFMRRIHSQSSGPAYKNRRARTAWFDPAKANKLVFPHWRVGLEYFKAVQRAPLDVNTQTRCHGVLICYVRSHWKGLAMDIIKNAEMALRV